MGMTLILTLAVCSLAFLALGLGLLLGRAPLRGSCGGLAVQQGGESCSVCGRPAGSVESCKPD